MTGARNGIISLWKDKQVENSVRIFDEWTLVLYKDCSIFAASRYNVVELNMSLEVIKAFHGRTSQPFTMDANANYLVVGYKRLDYVGYVDVHSRDELDHNGLHQKRIVSYTVLLLVNSKLTVS